MKQSILVINKMRGFYLLKPDMLSSKESINFYLDFINNSNIASTDNFYKISDWITLSKILYEPNIDNMSLEELKKLRRQMLVTIKGYDIFYKNKDAILSTININDVNRLQELFDFKKELRKKYVNNTKKHYIRFMSDIDLEKRLIDIDLDSIDYNTITIEPDQELNRDGYNMIFFNKLHFPDPTVIAIERDLRCIENMEIINEKNLIKELR